ncbi:hypothetical protein QMK19_32590 [Streptomyces sp. H10-C2]|uniref:hypothetical protein n=1 Tax=unclassified Streptomyces TaxID=2593676 RepID=UPI0024BA0970|nr:MULTISPECIES: hypothetical protein [unclassified Streptomyces]MDJ0345318.1 hypothetical protein [Streptomyces sp. PH10-H1]MDJ0374243.1 hypothetical protein [Streptomyces sp. H10-C2]
MRRLAALTAVAVSLCLLTALAGCKTGTGARREGPAPLQTAVKAQASSAPSIAGDPAALAKLVKKDTQNVSQEVRQDLAPCAGDEYPVDTSSGDLTSGDGPDLIVNVATCGDGMGIASYVYRMIDGQYQNVFTDEQPPVYGTADNGKLQIIRQVYKSDDRVCCPTGQEALTYVWKGNRFVQVQRTYTDSGDALPAPTSEKKSNG